MDSPKRNHYETLGILPTAGTRDIKRAYRRLAQKFHPDHNPDNASTNLKFKEISEAYDILKNEKTRAVYDQSQDAAPDRKEYPHYQTSWFARLKFFFADMVDAYRSDEYDSASFAMPLAFIAYAVIIVCGRSLLHLKFLAGFLLLALVAERWFRDDIGDYIAESSLRIYNRSWALILFAAFNIVHYQTFQRLFGGQGSLISYSGLIIYSVPRTLLFLFWLVFISHWNWLIFCVLLSLAWLVYKKNYKAAGRGLLGLQMTIATLIRFYPAFMSDFVIFYQPLFTIEPLQPAL